jgi:hypothetical protein
VVYDDVMSYINDGADVTSVSLEEVPFDNENGKGVENANAIFVHKEQTTPLQTYVEVLGLL